MIKELIKAHKFFCRKSQHYVMGNWNEYEEFVNFSNPNWGFWNKNKIDYYKGFIPAYIRFMSYTMKDLA